MQDLIVTHFNTTTIIPIVTTPAIITCKCDFIWHTHIYQLLLPTRAL